VTALDASGFPQAEEVLRLLAAAAGAARLYPPGSAMPRSAIAKFVERSGIVTASGPLRYRVEPQGMRLAGQLIAAGQTQVVALAESLLALQVGQLVLAPGVTVAETEAFISIINADIAMVRSAGGVRSALGQTGVRHIAVIEVSLRQSEESGLAGMDLTAAPLDDIAAELEDATARRAKAASEGVAPDEIADAVRGLEDATRQIALERMSEALLRMDEKSRMRVLALALQSDANGSRMDGMLDIIARMKPAALSRLLKLVASQAETDARRIAGALPLPPETLKALALLLTPAPDIAPDFGIPDSLQATRLAEELREEEDSYDLDRQMAVADPAKALGRALATATAVSRTHVSAESVAAIGEMLPMAAREGAFTTVREALRRLDEIGRDPRMARDVAAAHAQLGDRAVLNDICKAPMPDADAAIAGEILQAAGAAGAEALLECFSSMPEPQRSLLRPVLRTSSELVLGVARPKLRTADPATAVGMIRTLAALGDRRAVAVLADVLDGHIDEHVRFAAATSLADMPVPEAPSALIRALGHKDSETQRRVIRELGRIRAASAVPALVRLFDDVNVLARNYEVRKDVIDSLSAIGTPDAVKALRRFATRPAFGRKSRELKRRATGAAAGPRKTRGADAP
jgi:hypothetical protein